MRRTKEEAEQTREAILDAAERIFVEKGVDRVSLEEVAQAANFTRGAVHWHFRNKTGLLIALVDRIRLPFERLAGEVEIRPSLDPLDELVAIMTRRVRELQTSPSRRRFRRELLNFALLHAPEQQIAADRQFRDSIARIFRLAKIRGRLAPEWQADIAALAFYAMVTRLINDWMLSADPEHDLAREVGAAMRSFVKSVTGKKPAARK
jgi:TetR/AcrR family transcriptional regulator, acrAB operon repressor